MFEQPYHIDLDSVRRAFRRKPRCRLMSRGRGQISSVRRDLRDGRRRGWLLRRQ